MLLSTQRMSTEAAMVFSEVRAFSISKNSYKIRTNGYFSKFCNPSKFVEIEWYSWKFMKFCQIFHSLKNCRRQTLKHCPITIREMYNLALLCISRKQLSSEPLIVKSAFDTATQTSRLNFRVGNWFPLECTSHSLRYTSMFTCWVAFRSNALIALNTCTWPVAET